jgi:Protein of unknown function (DUF2958)
MELLSKELRQQLPPLYSREKVKNPMVVCKFVLPNTGWKWYAIEFDGSDTFYGYVIGQYKECGYFRLSELEYLDGLFGSSVELDKNFKPTKLSKVMQENA